MKATLISIMRGTFFVCGVLLAAGCIKINTTVSITADGSGTWKVVYAMPTHMIRQVQMARELTAELDKASATTVTNVSVKPLDIPMLFDEAAIRARFASLERDGLKLTKLQTRSRSGWQYVDLVVKFNRLEDLVRQRFFDDCGISFKQIGSNNSKIVISLPAGDAGERVDLTDPAVNKSLTPFMKGMVIVVNLEVPGDVRNSNSFVSDSKFASWQWDFEKDPKAVELLFRDKMVLVFDSSRSRIKDFDKPAVR